MAITAAMVKELREMTGAGMMDCKKALNETNGNMEEAVEFLRKNGQAKAEKKASRIAAEGICRIAVKDDKTAAVVEVNSETDFVAKNEEFQKFVEAVAVQAVNSDAADMDAFMAETWNADSSKTVQEALVEKVAVIGGGLTGCEIAYDLYLQGKQPVIVEMQEDLITTKGICLANTSYLRDFFKTNKVPTYLETGLAEIKENSVVLKDKAGNTFEVEADSVILSVGYKPAPVAEKSKHVHVIGDAQKVGNLRSVIWGAWNVCMKL